MKETKEEFISLYWGEIPDKDFWSFVDEVWFEYHCLTELYDIRIGCKYEHRFQCHMPKYHWQSKLITQYANDILEIAFKVIQEKALELEIKCDMQKIINIRNNNIFNRQNVFRSLDLFKENLDKYSKLDYN